MNIDEIIHNIKSDKYIFSNHAEVERKEDELEVVEVEEAIVNGNIIEDYPRDPRGESCLILGFSGEKPIHVVCGWNSDGWLLIITVYIPKPPKWLTPTKRGKGGK